MMKKVLFTLAFLATCFTASAQENKNDSLPQRTFWDRLSIGGYGELAFSRNFYSDHVSRYSQPEAHKNDPSHGRFDIPHFTIALGYDFGKGWTLGTEIEFEHGGNGIAYEKEDEEGGEWEQETEKGGEVELEQFRIQKSFAKWANIRAGHIVVPVGLNNAHHEPLNFFTVYRPEGENTILPSTWH
jgi:opacity protein-like surface antigen